MINAFTFAPTPQLHFGAGKISVLPGTVSAFGSKMLLVTGARSFVSSDMGRSLIGILETKGEVYSCVIDREPSPEMIDRVVKQFRESRPDVVVAIGGGSVVDAGKAISAMLTLATPVTDFLEGVGTLTHPGSKVPFIAIPTTAGTGSEATKNAVLSKTGDNGFKRSLRHNKFVPDVAIVDPALCLSCPPHVTAASGMDAFTQLLESYLSAVSNPVTDALALEGLSRIARSLKRAFYDGGDLNARTDMSLAAYLSGITLANAGLGLVHGFASSIGGYYDVPHGVVCSTMMPAANQVTVRKLRRTKENDDALRRYALVGKMFCGTAGGTDKYYCDALLGVIADWRHEMKIPSLSTLGINRDAFSRIASVTDNKNNPVPLDRDEIIEVLEMSA
ncbi:MAG TPA: iron-containing alcohol dehydrogenase [Chryseosolibacter sp.]|nr:iron-containing alcohol dehydrogenase [Chryseosolibacter sp.]